MRRVLWGTLVLALGTSTTAWAEQQDKATTPAERYQMLVQELQNAPEDLSKAKGQYKPDTPADQYKALLKEYQLASSPGVALSDEERMKFVGRVYRIRNELAVRFVELAEKNAKDPIALDCLMQAVWQVNGTPWPVELVGQDSAAPRALTLLLRDHIQSDKLGTVCQRVCFGFHKEYETFLRTVLEMSPHRDVQAVACIGMAHFLNNRMQRIDLVNEQPELAKEFEDLFGREYLKELQRQDGARAIAQAESLFEQAVEKYGDVRFPDGTTVGEKAKAELFESRHLRVGKQAPEIEGEDQDGVRFKLSDYRGKVVLLDFWSQA